MTRAALLVFAVVIALEGAAGADEPADVDAVAVAKFDEGRRALDEKRYEDATLAFRASLARQSSPNTRLLLAKALLEEGKIGSAYVLFKAAAREAQDRATLTREPRYFVTRDLANKELVALEPRVPRLMIVVPSTRPSDFVVTVNGVVAEPSSWGIAIEQDPGPVVVEASGQRLRPYRHAVELREGELARVDVAGERVPTAQIAVDAPLRPAGLSLSLDGRPLAPELLATVVELDPGTHDVVVRAPGYEPFVWTRHLDDGESLHVEAALRPDPRLEKRGTPLWLLVATSSTALAVAGIGTGLLVSAKSSDDDERAKDPLLRSDTREASIQDRARLGTGALITAGCFAVASAVLFFTTHRSR